ncbi:uncharacterized protein [Argopecten irradians]|uniref:uncharacterized protein n=1 Tax=Argopecten irradians TaxID=31199 RepID=UPI00371B908F
MITSNGNITLMGQESSTCQSSTEEMSHRSQSSNIPEKNLDTDQKPDESKSCESLNSEHLSMHTGQSPDESGSLHQECQSSGSTSQRSQNLNSSSGQRSGSEKQQEEGMSDSSISLLAEDQVSDSGSLQEGQSSGDISQRSQLQNRSSSSGQRSRSERGEEEGMSDSSISLLAEDQVSDSGLGDLEQSGQTCNTSSLSTITSCEMSNNVSAFVSSDESTTSSQTSSLIESFSSSILVNETVESVKCLKDRDIDMNDRKLLKYIDLLLCELKQCADNPLKKIQVMDEIVHAEFVVVCERLFKHLVDTDISKMVPGWPWLQQKKLLTVIWILSDGSITLCEQLVCSHCALKMMADLLKRLSEPCDLEKNNVTRYLVKAILGILHNVSRHLCDTNVRETLRETGVMTSLKILSLSRTPMVQAKSLFVMSYIVDESEIVVLSVDDNILKFIVEVLNDAFQSKTHFSSKFGMNVEETLHGLNNLAINDKNKVSIFKFGVLHIYVSLILEYNNTDEVFQAVSGIWRLAFHKKNCPGIRSHPQCIEALISLQGSKDEVIRHAARGALWELREVPELQLRPDLASLVVQCPHVMISYQWNSQPLVLRLKDVLKHAGYKVWMDVEHMTGSTLEAMALAVERSAVVLVCMSQKYKDSPSCRSEAEYTYKLRKSFIPLCVQERYVADGWLGMLIGTKLYFDISTEQLFDQQIPNLMKEIGDRGRLSTQTQNTDGEITSPGYVAKLTAVQPSLCTNWTTQDVADWTKRLCLSAVPSELLQLDGTMLWEMRRMLETSPDFLYTYIKV